jgi:hypothetical protein
MSTGALIAGVVIVCCVGIPALIWWVKRRRRGDASPDSAAGAKATQAGNEVPNQGRGES